jgi:hypothetical protein
MYVVRRTQWIDQSSPAPLAHLQSNQPKSKEMSQTMLEQKANKKDRPTK